MLLVGSSLRERLRLTRRWEAVLQAKQTPRESVETNLRTPGNPSVSESEPAKMSSAVIFLRVPMLLVYWDVEMGLVTIEWIEREAERNRAVAGGREI